MPWPMSQDYNEAIQTPAAVFSDPELKQGQPVCNAMGLPVPCSGNFADVYAVQTPQRKWAVKCFTREIPGIRERYIEISKYLAQQQLPFMVEFKFLDQGIRVRSQWYPALKMHWVEGFTLNHFVKQQLAQPAILGTLAQMWVKMAARLRESNLAHCDLQHGNVLMVPGAKAGMLSLRLVDYDGMCVPALELLKSIEVGHPNFQHPQRLKEGIYSIEVDRFSHLVIYTALRALMVGGQSLWEKFDNGDNLLFKQQDFANPSQSPVFRELQGIKDPAIRKLTDALAGAIQKPLDQTPLLEQLIGEGGVSPRSDPAATKKPTTGMKQPAGPTGDFAHLDPKFKRKGASGSNLGVIIGSIVAAVVVLGACGLFLMMGSSNKPTRTSVAEAPTHKDLEPTTTRKEAPATKSEPKVEKSKFDPKELLGKLDTKVEPKTEPKVEPPKQVDIRVMKDTDFQQIAIRFPPENNLARSGTARASGQYGDRRPQNVLAGNRAAQSWHPTGATGWLEAQWERAIKGRFVLLFPRPAGSPWRMATLSINGQDSIPIKGMSANHIAVIELPEVTTIRSLRLDLDAANNGEFPPGLAGIEIHLGGEGTTPTKSELIPIPPAAEIARADKALKELYKADYAKKSATDKLAFAQKLLEQGQKTKDDAAVRYVSYRDARDVAVSIPDPALAVQMVDVMAGEFVVDALELKSTALEQAGRAPSTPASNQALYETATTLVDQWLARDNHDQAMTLAKVAQSGAIRGKQQALITAAQAKVREIENLKKEFAAIQKAMLALADKPDDPALNLLLGKHRAFTQGNWEEGLPLLAKGGDGKLKDLATKDLAMPQEAKEQLTVGDGWYDLGEAESGAAKKQLQRRTAYWYQQALPGLTGLEQNKVEQRLKTIGPVDAAAVPISTWVALRPKVMRSTANAKFALQPDLSVLVSGGAERDSYVFVAETDLRGITGIRLEVLADDRLPRKGPGRARDGNFVLTELDVTAAPRSNPTEAQRITLRNPRASFGQSDFQVQLAIDGQRAPESRGWAILQEVGRNQWATFETTHEVGFGDGTILTFTLDHRYGEDQTIGRFRILVSTARPKPTSPNKVVLVKAEYGRADVREKLQKILDAGPFVAVTAHSSIAGFDPMPGVVKQFELDYELDGKPFSQIVREGEVFVPRPYNEGLPLADARKEFTIRAARYGAATVWLDVTAKVTALAKDPNRPIAFGAKEAGKDPLFGTQKFLVVWFDLEGVRYMRAIRDGDTRPLR